MAFSGSSSSEGVTNLAASDSINIPSSSIYEEKVTWKGRIIKVLYFPIKALEYFVSGTLIVIMMVEMAARQCFGCTEPHSEDIYNQVGYTFLGIQPKF